MAYGFTRICDECVAKSSTGRAPDYILHKEFGEQLKGCH